MIGSQRDPDAASCRLPYLSCRYRRNGPPVVYYRRRLTAEQKAVLGGRSTLTFRLQGHPDGSAAQRRDFARSYAAADQAAEEKLAAAAATRSLTPQEQLGVAGAALQGERQHPDTVDRHELSAVLVALQRLNVVLPVPLPPDWRLGPVADDRAVVDAAERLAWALAALPRPPAPRPWRPSPSGSPPAAPPAAPRSAAAAGHPSSITGAG